MTKGSLLADFRGALGAFLVICCAVWAFGRILGGLGVFPSLWAAFDHFGLAFRLFQRALRLFRAFLYIFVVLECS